MQIESGVLGGLLPELVDLPLWLTGVTVLHTRSLHEGKLTSQKEVKLDLSLEGIAENSTTLGLTCRLD